MKDQLTNLSRHFNLELARLVHATNVKFDDQSEIIANTTESLRAEVWTRKNEQENFHRQLNSSNVDLFSRMQIGENSTKEQLSKVRDELLTRLKNSTEELKEDQARLARFTSKQINQTRVDLQNESATAHRQHQLLVRSLEMESQTLKAKVSTIEKVCI